MAGGLLPSDIAWPTTTDTSPQSQPPSPPQAQNTLEIPQQQRPTPPKLPKLTPPQSSLGSSPFNYPVPPDLMFALGHQESGNNPTAVGKAGEIGQFQMLPETAKHYGYTPDQMRDPWVQYKATQQYLGELLKRYHGNEFLALVAYNSGPGRVDKGKLLPQSVKYATNILGRRNALASRSGGPGGGNVPLLRAQNLPPGGAPSGASSGGPTDIAAAGAPMMQTAGSMPPPLMMPQQLSQAGGGYPGVQQAPWYQRMAQSLAGGLEGTAQAQEAPPGAAQQPGAPAAPSYTVNPMTGNVVQQQPQGQAQPGQDEQFPSDAPSRTTSIHMSPSGGMSFGQTTRDRGPTALQQQQFEGAMTTLGQVNDALQAFAPLQKKLDEGQYQGSLLTEEGRRRWKVPLTYAHSLKMGAIGMDETDPDFDTLAAKLGPIQAGQLKSLTGGRVGEGIASFLGPHLPNPTEDDLPHIHEKLQAMRENLKLTIMIYSRMHNLHMSDDDINFAIGQQKYKMSPELQRYEEEQQKRVALGSGGYSAQLQQAAPSAAATPAPPAHAATGEGLPPGSRPLNDGHGGWTLPNGQKVWPK